MHKKEVRTGHRGNDTDVRRKEKENRKLQLELRSEREKLNSTIIKFQKEMNDMQVVRKYTHTHTHTQTHTIFAHCTGGDISPPFKKIQTRKSPAPITLERNYVT